MPFDDEKIRLENRLLGLLSQALQDRNRLCEGSTVAARIDDQVFHARLRAGAAQRAVEQRHARGGQALARRLFDCDRQGAGFDDDVSRFPHRREFAGNLRQRPGRRQRGDQDSRLPGNVEPYFLERLEQEMPLRYQKIVNRIKEVKGGVLNRSQFGLRMRGEGEFWKMVTKSFEVHARRLGYDNQRYRTRFRQNSFRRPTAQGSLFE